MSDLRAQIWFRISGFILAIFFTSLSFALNVVIDPGHGGVDKGAVRGNLKEAEVVLQVSKLLEDLIRKDPTMRASMTRERDETLSLQDRVTHAQKADADLLVSIHANASTDSRAKGIEFYFQNQLPPDEETLLYASQENQLLKEEAESDGELSPSQNADLKLIVEDLRQQTRIRRSYQFAQSLIGHWPESVSSRNQVLRQAPFFMVSKGKMPSVLIEIGFISNPKEAKKLASGEFQQEIAEKIYQGIKSYRDTVKK